MPARGAKPHPNSRIQVVGRSSNFTKGRPGAQRRAVAPYPCPRCRKRMYGDEVIDFGTVEVDGVKHTGKYHRNCPEVKK